MDSALVEKITKLVLSKLEEVSKLESHSQPLTQGEINRWNEITASMQGQGTAKSEAVKEESKLRPLSESEISRWNDITCAMNDSNSGSATNVNNATFYKYGS